MADKAEFKTIDEYIAQFPPEIRELLTELRKTIRAAAPEASEKISWQMPTFYLNGNLVHFAAHTRHIGFYPGASGMEAFRDRLAEYKTSKGAVQFPFDKPVPHELVRDIVEFKVAENMGKASGEAE